MALKKPLIPREREPPPLCKPLDDIPQSFLFLITIASLLSSRFQRSQHNIFWISSMTCAEDVLSVYNVLVFTLEQRICNKF